MSTLEESALRVADDLSAAGYEFALVGGLAVAARARPRTTLDVDFAVAVESDAAAEELVFELQGRGYELVDVIEQTEQGRLATARFRLGSTALREASVDLLFASSGIEPEVVASAERIRVLPELEIPVARRGHLLALKILAHDEERRPQDRQDILALLREAGNEDVRLARDAVRMITARGFHRHKDLAADLDRFIDLAQELGAP